MIESEGTALFSPSLLEHFFNYLLLIPPIVVGMCYGEYIRVECHLRERECCE